MSQLFLVFFFYPMKLKTLVTCLASMCRFIFEKLFTITTNHSVLFCVFSMKNGSHCCEGPP